MPVACLCVEDRQDVPARRPSCEEATEGVYATGLIRPLKAEDTTTGLPGCDTSGCTGEIWLCFGVGTAKR